MLVAKAYELERRYRQQLFDMTPNVALTFNYGYRIDSIKAQGLQSKFFQMAQRKFYGRNWASQWDRQWPVVYGFFEHPKSNPHYHALAKVEVEFANWLLDYGDEVWRRVARRGQLDVQEVYDTAGAIGYWLKGLARDQTFEDVWVYKDTREATIGKSCLKVGRES